IIEITGKWPPLSLVYLAGHLRQAGFDVEIYDAMAKDHTLADVKQKIITAKPDAVLIGAFTSSVNTAIDTLRLVKSIDASILTVLGGIHASFLFEEILERNNFVDFIVRGEGEITIVELLNALNENLRLLGVAGIAYRDNGRIIATGGRELIDDLDTLIPAWDLIDWEDYSYKVTGRRLGLIGSSRGCPYKCRFCSQHLFWKGMYRERSPEHFVREVEYLHRTYGIGMFMLADEYTTYNRTRWEKILDLLLEKNLDIHFSMETRADDILRDKDILWKYRSAGFVHVYVGVETVKQQILNYYDKGLTVEQTKEAIRLLNEAGIISECSFILGDLGETEESIDLTLTQSLKINPDFAHFLLITPWPYTRLYEQLSEHIVDLDYSRYHFVHPIVKPLNMDIDTLWLKIVNCFKIFYMKKARQVLNMNDEFKRGYMLKSIQIMHKEFFAKNFGHKAIELPEELGNLIEEILHKDDGSNVSSHDDSPTVKKLEPRMYRVL
ncbi:MAG: B12-binding domain-containing radical SAM protein, partial [Firmicutes bacterium]|nr:B12-binding domain-containing radical SAM protein [Bacillota bacterium]